MTKNPKFVRIWRHECLRFVSKNVKCTITLLSNLALSCKVQNTCMIWSRISLLSIYLGEKKTSFHIQTGTLPFLVALFVMANNLKQSQFLSSCELINVAILSCDFMCDSTSWNTTEQYKRRNN